MIKDMILKGAQRLDSAEDFNIDRSKYMNASSAMTCIRKQWFERHADPVEQDWGYARRGKQAELYVIDCLQATGAQLLYVGEDQFSVVDEATRISATPDGFLNTADGMIGLEIKSVDPRTNKKRLPRDEHVRQLQIAMAVSARNGHVKADRGLLIYIDASNYNDLLEFEVPCHPELLDELAPRAKRMLDARKVDRLDREGKRTGECQKYGGCPYAALCGVDVAEAGTATVSRGNTGSKLDEAVRAYTMAKADEEVAKAAKSDAAETIKTEMKARSATELPVGNHAVKLTVSAGRVSVDWRKAEKAGLDLEPYKKVGASYETLTVK